MAVAALATLIGLSAWLMQAVLGRVVPGAPHETWGGVFRLVEAELFLILVAIAYATAHRWPVEGRRHWRRVAGQLLLGLVISFVFGAIIHALAPALRPWWYAKRGGEIVGSSAKDAMFGYALAAGLAYGVVRWHAQRARQIAALDVRRRATAAQLTLLALDLQPHAMLRTMDALTGLIASDPDAANEGLVLLATSLGATLDGMRAGGLTLAAELAHVQAVLRLHALTTGQHVTCSGAIDGAECAVVPPRLLPGAVETVLAALPAGCPGPIAVSGTRDGAQLAITIRVPGSAALPAAVGGWADRQTRALAHDDAETAPRVSCEEGDHGWALSLRVTWRVLPLTGAPEMRA